MLLVDQGASSNSLNISLTANNAGTLQTGRIYAAYGTNPYLRFAPPNASGVATPTIDLRSDLMSFPNDNTVDIGATASGRPKNIYAAGTIVVGTSIGIGSITVSETELGILAGATVSTTELNFVKDVTSSIQDQINSKGSGTVTETSTDTLTNKSIDAGNNTITNVGFTEISDEMNGMFDIVDGMAYDKADMVILDATGLKLDVEKITTGGDMTFAIDGVLSVLDCTTGAGVGGKARVVLTAGANYSTPATNYIYVTDIGGVATLNASSSLPTGAFSWIGKIVVPDATTWATTGAYVFQRYTESFQNDSRGALSHEREKLRALGAVFINGVSQTLNITTNASIPDNVHLATGSGSIYQLHRQTFPAFTTGPYYYGNGVTPYNRITDLNASLSLANGSAIGNLDRFNLVLWGAVNITTGECKLFVNCPTAVYNKDSQAMSDENNTADLTVFDDSRSVAFMISRIAMKYSTSNGGTWTNLGVYSLLGTPVGARSGGTGAVASTEFDDSQLKIYNTTDPTKDIKFDASGVATATTRTVTMPDRNVNLGHVNGGVSLNINVPGTLDTTTTTLIVLATQFPVYWNLPNATLVDCKMAVDSAVTTGTEPNLNVTLNAVNSLTSYVSVNETLAAGVINTANDDIDTGQYVDIDYNKGNGNAKDLAVYLQFKYR